MISFGSIISFRSYVPLDDHHAILITQNGNPDGPVPPELVVPADDPFGEVGGYEERSNDPRSYFLTRANKTNDYHRDLDVERTLMHCGIPFVLSLQDRAMTELMCGADGELRTWVERRAERQQDRDEDSDEPAPRSAGE